MTTIRAIQRIGHGFGICVAALATLVLAVTLLPASALATQSPQWSVTAISGPTNLPPEGTGVYTVTVTNTGDAPSDGSTIVVADTLPAGLSLGAGGISAEGSEIGDVSGSCLGLTCEYLGSMATGDSFTLAVPVVVEPGAASSVTNTVTVSGGGAPAASVMTPTTVSSAPAGFGIAPGSVMSVLSSTQAGAHANLTTSLAFNTIANPHGPVFEGPYGPESTGPVLAGNPRSEVADLPPGFAGDLADTPTCSLAVFDLEEGGLHNGNESGFACPLSTQVGTILLRVISNDGEEHLPILTPVFNLAPNPGEVAKLGFFAGIFAIQGELSVKPGDYGIQATFQNDPDIVREFESFQLTVWGVPAEPSHDAMRGVYCQNGIGNCRGPGLTPGGVASTSPDIPFLSNPTQCSGNPLQGQLSVTSWEPGDAPQSVSANIGVVTGCKLLEFDPSVTVAPDTSYADTPAGLTVDVKVPQEGLISPEGLSSADIQDTTVTLPEGVVINPGQAAGLAACQPGEEAIGEAGPTSCPSASIVGHDEVRTPLLNEKLEGDVYVLQSNPPDLKVLVEAAQPTYGIHVKVIGDVHLNAATGQLTTTFEGTPELPFSDFKLSFSGGAQAALATPTRCGVYRSNGVFVPWSAPIGQEALSSSEFAIDAGTGGAPCPGSSLPFTPELIAGSTTDQAGGFTDFSLLLSRPDDQQRVSGLQFKVPEGLLGVIAKVPLCGEPQAADGTCSAGSQIGHTVVESGPGPYPLVVPQPGEPPAPIYLTGGYKGSPYGLSIVVPLHVGPFTLETQVVRAKLEINPVTAQLTVTTDAFPSIIDGIPADLRTIDAVIDRPEFMFNPTNCDPMSFGGTATSTEGATAGISSHFQVGSCQSLKFKPQFTVQTSAHTSRVDGASLHVALTLPNAPWGTQANVARVKVSLPKQLPSPLKTLQKACTEQVFAENPASCPLASRVGEVKVSTPVLDGGLSGPAYFVSHGGAKYPELIMVLTGEGGVTVQVHGETFISKAGITSATFNTVPDVPFSTFELTLPQREYPAITANGNLCKSTLIMPTEIAAQNGLLIKQNTKIAVTGCPKTKKAAKKKTKTHRVHGKKKG